MYSLHQREPGTCPSLFQSLASGYISKERGNFGLIPKLNLDYSSQKNISSPSLGSFMSFLPQLWMPCASFSSLLFLLTKPTGLQPVGCVIWDASLLQPPQTASRQPLQGGFPFGASPPMGQHHQVSHCTGCSPLSHSWSPSQEGKSQPTKCLKACVSTGTASSCPEEHMLPFPFPLHHEHPNSTVLGLVDIREQVSQ